ncbi:MAG: replication-associated recombination protein A [Glaciecola sp.]|jgi:putative ATPase
MTDLFDAIPDESMPLAARVRPQTLAHYIGQEHITAATAPLGKLLQAKRCHSMILWGPPGTGKTTLAELIAREVNAPFIRLSAVTSGVKDIREAMLQAQQTPSTIVFVDEVHRFNKAQQDAFLPYIESGLITFIGATTENPAFSCNNALLSRCRVYILKALSDSHLTAIVTHALQTDPLCVEAGLTATEDALTVLCQLVTGDARKALLYIELASSLAEDGIITPEQILLAAGQKQASFDLQGDIYYDHLSAFHKSVRGSSVDGALYWFARFSQATGDPTPIMRRLLAIATEDIGLADPKALTVCLNAWDTYHRVGAAEGERAVAEACVYCALAPKSNALYRAFKAAKQLAQDTSELPVPDHLRNAPTSLAKSQGHGEGYRYSHNEAHAVSAGQTYLPEGLAEPGLYQATNRGFEQTLAKKQAFLAQVNEAAGTTPKESAS